MIFLSHNFGFLSRKTRIPCDNISQKSREQRALIADPPYTIFHEEKISLRLSPKFMTKVILEFNLNQTIHLLVFSPKSYDIRVDRGFTLQMCKEQLEQNILEDSLDCFHPFWNARKVKQFLLRRGSKGNSSCILLCYELTSIPPLQGVRICSTKAQAVSVASLNQVPLTEICYLEFSPYPRETLCFGTGLGIWCCSGLISLPIDEFYEVLAPSAIRNTACSSPTVEYRQGPSLEEG